jgi:integrase
VAEKKGDYGATSATKLLKAEFGTIPLTKFVLLPKEIVQALDRVSEDKGATYWRKTLSAWNTWFRWVVTGELYGASSQAGMTLANPFTSEYVKKASKAHPKKVQRVVMFGADLIGKILFHSDAMMKLRVRAAINTGLRRQEMLAVRKGWVQLDGRKPRIVMPAPKTKGGKTTFREQIIPLDLADESFLTSLRERIKRLPADGYVFGHEDGSKLSAEVFKDMWPPVFQAAGIEVSGKLDENLQPLGKKWHDLRHEYGWRIARKTNGNAIEIQSRMRLADLDTVQFYVNHCEEDTSLVANG